MNPFLQWRPLPFVKSSLTIEAQKFHCLFSLTLMKPESQIIAQVSGYTTRQPFEFTCRLLHQGTLLVIDSTLLTELQKSLPQKCVIENSTVVMHSQFFIQYPQQQTAFYRQFYGICCNVTVEAKKNFKAVLQFTQRGNAKDQQLKILRSAVLSSNHYRLQKHSGHKNLLRTNFIKKIVPEYFPPPFISLFTFQEERLCDEFPKHNTLDTQQHFFTDKVNTLPHINKNFSQMKQGPHLSEITDRQINTLKSLEQKQTENQFFGTQYEQEIKINESINKELFFVNSLFDIHPVVNAHLSSTGFSKDFSSSALKARDQIYFSLEGDLLANSTTQIDSKQVLCRKENMNQQNSSLTNKVLKKIRPQIQQIAVFLSSSDKDSTVCLIPNGTVFLTPMYAKSLKSKLLLMHQACELLRQLHLKKVGCALRFQDLGVTPEKKLLLFCLLKCYYVEQWQTDLPIVNNRIDSKRIQQTFNQDKKLIFNQKQSGKRKNIVSTKQRQIYEQDWQKQKVEKNKQFKKVKLQNLIEKNESLFIKKKEREDDFELGFVLCGILLGVYQTERPIVDLRGVEFRMGILAKIGLNLALRCLHSDFTKRPYVEWMSAVFKLLASFLPAS